MADGGLSAAEQRLADHIIGRVLASLQDPTNSGAFSPTGSTGSEQPAAGLDEKTDISPKVGVAAAPPASSLSTAPDAERSSSAHGLCVLII